jgi:hypothetical protein
MRINLSRRQFLLAGAASAAVAALPSALVEAVRAASSATLAGGTTTFYFLNAGEATTCAAICERIVPSTDPLTGGPAPGAKEAGAVVFIDRLLAAFQLPESVADHPAIYLRGPYSNRNPYPDFATGEPSASRPADDFLSPSGQAHFVDIDEVQQLGWRMLIEGQEAALSQAPGWISKAWMQQVKSGLIPGPPAQGLQQIYRAGLAAFDAYSQGLFKVPFAEADGLEQDLMLEAAGNIVLSELPLPAPVGPPTEAKTLFPYIQSHTFEGCYGLPEYRWRDSNPLWAEIRWDGDTQPLGSSVYDENLYGPGEGPNEGFGEPGVFVPRGGYREHRPVSYIGPDPGREIDEHDIAPLVDAWKRLGIFRSTT